MELPGPSNPDPASSAEDGSNAGEVGDWGRVRAVRTGSIMNWIPYKKLVGPLHEHLERDEKRTSSGWFHQVRLVHLVGTIINWILQKTSGSIA